MVVPNKLLLYYLHLFILLEAIKHCKVHDFGEEDILLYIPFADLWNNLKNLARLIYRNLQITNKTNMIPVWSQLLEKTGEIYVHKLDVTQNQLWFINSFSKIPVSKLGFIVIIDDRIGDANRSALNLKHEGSVSVNKAPTLTNVNWNSQCKNVDTIRK